MDTEAPDTTVILDSTVLFVCPHLPLTIRLRHSPAFAARSHGWCYLGPFEIDGDRLDWAIRLPKGGARRVSVRWSDGSDAVRVAWRFPTSPP